MTKRVIEGEQSIMGTIFFIFKVNTVEKGPFPTNAGQRNIKTTILCVLYLPISQSLISKRGKKRQEANSDKSLSDNGP